MKKKGFGNRNEFMNYKRQKRFYPTIFIWSWKAAFIFCSVLNCVELDIYSFYEAKS